MRIYITFSKLFSGHYKDGIYAQNIVKGVILQFGTFMLVEYFFLIKHE